MNDADWAKDIESLKTASSIPELIQGMWREKGWVLGWAKYAPHCIKANCCDPSNQGCDCKMYPCEVSEGFKKDEGWWGRR
jgi:hypothetical protein